MKRYLLFSRGPLDPSQGSYLGSFMPQEETHQPELPGRSDSGYSVTILISRGLPLVWLKQMLSNTKGILSVLDMIIFRPLPGGLLPDNHPWTTGIDPDTGRTVWSDNVVFASPRKERWAGDARHWPAADDVILNKVGTYLAGMAKKSASTLENPFGASGRMPPAVNYIHGTVQYNAGILLFNDFDEGVFYLSDPRFVAEMQRFARETKREIMIVFRERLYEPRAYATNTRPIERNCEVIIRASEGCLIVLNKYLPIEECVLGYPWIGAADQIRTLHGGRGA